jgi:MEMO1 family protein
MSSTSRRNDLEASSWLALDLRNSGDTAGPRDRVVGYGAWAFWENEAAHDSDDDTVRHHGQLVNDLARRAICGNGAIRGLDKIPPALIRAGACFVTLHKAGDLRGCCGTILARRPLIQDISANALRAAYQDPRSIPLEQGEWKEVSLSVTLLSPLQPMSFTSEAELLSKVQPFEDGLLIEDAGWHAVFLPAVWEMLPDKQEFLERLKEKAGLPRRYWSSNYRVSRFYARQTLKEELHQASFEAVA